MKTITSLQHPLVKHFVRLRDKRAYRESQQAVVVEGIKIIEELCLTQSAQIIIMTEAYKQREDFLSDERILVSEAVMKKISGVETPEGIVAQVAMPAVDPCLGQLSGKKFIVVLDGVSDPGNMGSLLRTALALGWEGVFITSGSCDPFNDKALRAAKGATFRLPIAIGSWDRLNAILVNEEFCAIVADIEGDFPEMLTAEKKIALILGNEATGASENAKQRFPKITIPMTDAMESLNVAVAGAILMFLIKG